MDVKNLKEIKHEKYMEKLCDEWDIIYINQYKKHT